MAQIGEPITLGWFNQYGIPALLVAFAIRELIGLVKWFASRSRGFGDTKLYQPENATEQRISRCESQIDQHAIAIGNNQVATASIASAIKEGILPRLSSVEGRIK